MRRLLAILLTLAAALAGGSVLAVAGPAGAQVPPDDPRLGLIYDGLRKAGADGLCQGAFEAFLDEQLGAAMTQVLCTHGPDPAPDGVDVRDQRGPVPAAELTAPSGSSPAEGSVPCYGDGSSGFRVQLVYAHSSAGADRYSTYADSFRSWAGRLDRVVADSAAETGGTRHVRFVTDSGCNPVVSQVALSPSGMSNFTNMVSELQSLGYTRTDRKYLVWSDANSYCGISELYVDDSPDATPGQNYNNGNSTIQGSIGRVDNGCWGLTNMVEAHELVHLLGGVQASAPHATPGFHCTDESDRLCYADGTTSAPLLQACPAAHEALYDCNHDDYFSTAPPPGSYLSTHWNTASSAFLSGQATSAPPATTTTTAAPPTTVAPTTTTVAPPTTTTVAPPTTTTVAPPTTTTTPATTTTVGPTTATTTATTVGPATTVPPPPPPPSTIQPSVARAPSAPASLRATQPAVGSGVTLAWQPPSTGPVSGYRIYRGTSPYTQTLLATVDDVLGFNDASAGRAVYYYRVTAFNDAGEGPASALAVMLGKTTTSAGVVREQQDQRFVVSDTQLRSAWSWRFA